MSRGPAEFWSFSSGDRICRQVAAAPMSVRDTHAQDVYNSRADGQYECATGIEHCQCVELYEPRRICQSLENPRGIVLCHCGWRFLLLSPPLSPSPCIYIYAIYLCIGCVGHRCRGGYHIKMLLLHLASRMRAGFELHLLLLLLVTMMVVTGFNWLLCTNTALHLYCTSRCLCPIVTQFAPTLNRRHHYHHHPLVPQAPAIREKSRGGQTCRVGVESRQMLERGRQSRSNWKPLSLSLTHTHTQSMPTHPPPSLMHARGVRPQPGDNNAAQHIHPYASAIEQFTYYCKLSPYLSTPASGNTLGSPSCFLVHPALVLPSHPSLDHTLCPLLVSIASTASSFPRLFLRIRSRWPALRQVH